MAMNHYPTAPSFSDDESQPLAEGSRLEVRDVRRIYYTNDSYENNVYRQTPYYSPEPAYHSGPQYQVFFYS